MGTKIMGSTHIKRNFVKKIFTGTVVALIEKIIGKKNA